MTEETKYNCSFCDYHTNVKGGFNQHIKTKKHAKLARKSQVIDCNCGNKYMDIDAFLKHKNQSCVRSNACNKKNNYANSVLSDSSNEDMENELNKILNSIDDTSNNTVDNNDSGEGDNDGENSQFDFSTLIHVLFHMRMNSVGPEAIRGFLDSVKQYKVYLKLANTVVNSVCESVKERNPSISFTNDVLNDITLKALIDITEIDSTNYHQNMVNIVSDVDMLNHAKLSVEAIFLPEED